MLESERDVSVLHLEKEILCSLKLERHFQQRISTTKRMSAVLLHLGGKQFHFLIS